MHAYIVFTSYNQAKKKQFFSSCSVILLLFFVNPDQALQRSQTTVSRRLL
jgi:hypothetical protein